MQDTRSTDNLISQDTVVDKVADNKGRVRLFVVGVIVVICVATAFVVYYSTRLSVQGWLDRFERAIVNIAEVPKDSDNYKPSDIERSITIIDNNGVLQVEYRQRLTISVVGSSASAYLRIEERYPASSSAGDLDIVDEYYFALGKMYTRRVNGDDSVLSSFDSSIEILMQVAKENIGGARYNFREEYFETLAGDKPIVQHKNGTHILHAKINSREYKGFFGTSISNTITQASINYTIDNKHQLSVFNLLYNDSGNSISVEVAANAPQEINKPEWVL